MHVCSYGGSTRRCALAWASRAAFPRVTGRGRVHQGCGILTANQAGGPGDGSARPAPGAGLDHWLVGLAVVGPAPPRAQLGQGRGWAQQPSVDQVSSWPSGRRVYLRVCLLCAPVHVPTCGGGRSCAQGGGRSGTETGGQRWAPPSGRVVPSGWPAGGCGACSHLPPQLPSRALELKEPQVRGEPRVGSTPGKASGSSEGGIRVTLTPVPADRTPGPAGPGASLSGNAEQKPRPFPHRAAWSGWSPHLLSQRSHWPRVGVSVSCT